MNIKELKPFLEFYLKHIRYAKKLISCNMIDDINRRFYYKTKERYHIPVEMYLEYDDPDSYALGLYFDLEGLPSEFNIKSIHFDTKDKMICWEDKNENDVPIEYEDFLNPEEFFQTSLIHNLGDTDLQYWKDCIKLLETIEKELIDV